MRYGYCRTSKPKQSIERQIRNIKAAYPDAVIVQAVFTRTRLDRAKIAIPAPSARDLSTTFTC